MGSIEFFACFSVTAVLRVRGILLGSAPLPSASELLYFHLGELT